MIAAKAVFSEFAMRTEAAPVSLPKRLDIIPFVTVVLSTLGPEHLPEEVGFLACAGCVCIDEVGSDADKKVPGRTGRSKVLQYFFHGIRTWPFS